MLEQFKVMPENEIRVTEDSLRETVVLVLLKMGVPEADCVLAADVLITADLRGVETHGVSNMLRSYVAGYNSGELNSQPNWKITRETPSTANIDGDRGLGVIVTPKAMDIAISKAKDVGMGVVTIHNSRHLGMASYHALKAVDHNMIGMCVTSCPPSVLPTFGSEPALGTNPIAFAAPAGNKAPFVFDAAMSAVAVLFNTSESVIVTTIRAVKTIQAGHWCAISITPSTISAVLPVSVMANPSGIIDPSNIMTDHSTDS